MIRLQISRFPLKDSKVILRAFCDKKCEKDTNLTVDDAEVVSSTNETSNSITNKINRILISMAENSKLKSQEKLELKSDDIGIRYKKTKTSEKTEKSEDDKLISAAEAAAAILEGDKKQITQELVNKVINREFSSKTYDWSEMVTGMNIDKTKAGEDNAWTNKRSIEGRKGFSNRNTHRRSTATDGTLTNKFKIENIDLFGGKPLGIFQKGPVNYGTNLKTWDELKKNDQKLAVMRPPSNYFEKMILWTNQGKIWKFPIDNEQGLDEEKKVHFSEHIFLENHLDAWCPQRGPIRHFMELVCVGLSKNPYYTAKDKKDHIEWFKNYFESKRKLLEEVGALEKTAEVSQSISA